MQTSHAGIIGSLGEPAGCWSPDWGCRIRSGYPRGLAGRTSLSSARTTSPQGRRAAQLDAAVHVAVSGAHLLVEDPDECDARFGQNPAVETQRDARLRLRDLEPELFIDGCFLGGPSVADDTAQVAKASDEGANVVFIEPAAGLVADLAAVADEGRCRCRCRCRRWSGTRSAAQRRGRVRPGRHRDSGLSPSLGD